MKDVTRVIFVGMVLWLMGARLAAEDEPVYRLFISDGETWEMGSRDVAVGGDNVAASQGVWGARPQQVEMMKTVKERCPDTVRVTVREERADYVLILERESGKGLALKDNKWVLITPDGDMVDGGSTRAMGNAIKDACKALIKDAR